MYIETGRVRNDYLITIVELHVLRGDAEPAVERGLELLHRLVHLDHLLPRHLAVRHRHAHVRVRSHVHVHLQ